MKPFIKKCCAAVLICCVGGLAGCTGQGTASPAPASSTGSSAVSSSSPSAQAGKKDFSLPVSLSKSLNPLTTDTMTNLTLWPLMFDCLAEPDPTYKPVLGLASSIQNEGTTVTVRLRSGVKFTDGTTLKAWDVKFSYDLVKATPTSFFYPNVENIESIRAEGDLTVVFTLRKPDALIANLLTIPIIKKVADPNKTLIGSGRYAFSSDGLNGRLTYHENWYKGAAPAFKTIRLVNIYNSNAILSTLKLGDIDYFFTDYGNGAASPVGLATKSVNLNRMIFIGVNSNNAQSPLANPHVRRGICLAIDRKSIVSDIYSSRAIATPLPFNPDWSALYKLSGNDVTANYGQAAAEFAAANYTHTGANGALVNSGTPSSSLNLRLLVDQSDITLLSAAKKIASSLSKAGVIVNVEAKSSAEYDALLAAGNFDLYLGEIRLNDNMDLSPLLAPGGAASFGVPAGCATYDAFSAYQAGQKTINEVVSAFRNETPLIPLCYRMGTVSYAPALSGNITPTFQDIFFNMETWHY